MKILSTLALSLASIATLAGSAAASTNLVGPIGDGPIFDGPIGRAPVACPATKKASASKSFSFNPLQSEAGLTWKFGFKATPAINADCDKLSVDLGFSATAGWGPLTVEPFKVVVSGSTNKSHVNALTVSYYTFGMKVKDDPIASGPATLAFSKNMDLTLPVNHTFQWSWMHEFEIPGPNINAQVNARAEIVAIGGLFAQAEIAQTGITSNLLSSASAYADASGSVSISGVSLSASTRLDLFWYVVGAHANLLPKNGGFNADIGYSITARDVLGAHLSFDVPLYGRYTVFELTPSDYGDDFEFTKDFTKGF